MENINVILFKGDKTYVLVFGSRTFDDYELMCEVLDSLYPDPSKIVVIEGEATGADQFSRKWAEARGAEVLPMKADWSRHGGGAGFLRNSMMVEHCTEGVGFWDGVSRGTKDTMVKLKAAGKKCTVIDFVPKPKPNVEKDANKIVNDLELVPLIAQATGDECVHDQPCIFGLRVDGHAVYCENDEWPDKPRKCHRSWYTGGKERDEGCPGFKQNPDYKKKGE